MDIYHIHGYLPHPWISTTSMHIYHIHAYLPYFCRFILIFHQMALNFYRFHLVRFWVFTQKMKMQWSSFSEMTSFFHAYLPFFCRFILIFHQMALNFSIVFTLSGFEYSPRKWKCSGPAFRKWCHFFASSCVLVSDHCKQSITVWLLLTDIVLKFGTAYQRENCLTMTN